MAAPELAPPNHDDRLPMTDDRLVLCDSSGNPTGTASRGECHGRPDLMHAVVHVIVTNAAGEILLQKRAATKDVAPDKWDTSVGGHVAPGEQPEDAARREMQEELGVRPTKLTPAYGYAVRTPNESEYTRSFVCTHEGPFYPNPDEVTEVRFDSCKEIEARLGKGDFTPHFEEEYRRWRKWCRAGAS